MPFKEKLNEPEKCLKYLEVNYTQDIVKDKCDPKSFDMNSTEKCNQWVFYDPKEKTIVNDVSHPTATRTNILKD